MVFLVLVLCLYVIFASTKYVLASMLIFFLKFYSSFVSVFVCVSVLFCLVCFYLYNFIFIMFLDASLYSTGREKEKGIYRFGWVGKWEGHGTSWERRSIIYYIKKYLFSTKIKRSQADKLRNRKDLSVFAESRYTVTRFIMIHVRLSWCPLLYLQCI